ncbi:putative transcriptional regulatory protein TcrX [Dyadobacter sp. CECT 9275]|uniref:Transcriptional regulatory protein TcrX n=1 Tax=Dyadobacter helix TaxID=2822344 RepID=A0A916N232_9BACT|nr:response regulator transcription factor [Dyadobacter sp. CECT 9275]CAG4988345.1 putative transcriptional regulatory protein TcrX [Dyadobacter sp. CECT 9275]
MSNNGKVLLVEDEAALGQIISDVLMIKGFKVIHITDGALAYSTYLKEKPQIIVLDVMLPAVNGLDIAGRIRQEDKQTPILFLTARSTTEDLIKGFTAGGNDYIKKPFDLEELAIRMEVLMNRNRLLAVTEHRAEDRVAIGIFQYDRMRHTLLYAGRLIRLSARESEVLTILYQHRTRLLTRKTLLLEVWKNDDFFSSRSLDVYISKLRRHFHPDPSVQIINHRGFGYKLIC